MRALFRAGGARTATSLPCSPSNTHLDDPQRSRCRAGEASRKPPLLFVHGGYCDAWCWEPIFPAVVRGARLSGVRAQPARPRRERRRRLAVHRRARRLRRRRRARRRDAAGAAGADRPFDGRGDRRAHRRQAPGARRGAARAGAAGRPAADRGAARRRASRLPDAHERHSIRRGCPTTCCDTLRPFYFSADVAAGVLAEARGTSNVESPRALFDLSLRLHWALPTRDHRPVFVLGAEGDRICTPDDVRATARHHGVDATILPGPRAHADARAGMGTRRAAAEAGCARSSTLE